MKNIMKKITAIVAVAVITMTAGITPVKADQGNTGSITKKEYAVEAYRFVTFNIETVMEQHDGESMAVETIKDGFGDSLDKAVLLTGLLQAKGIKARVAFGQVLNEDESETHYWVVAKIGKKTRVFDPAYGAAACHSQYSLVGYLK